MAVDIHVRVPGLQVERGRRRAPALRRQGLDERADARRGPRVCDARLQGAEQQGLGLRVPAAAEHLGQRRHLRGIHEEVAGAVALHGLHVEDREARRVHRRPQQPLVCGPVRRGQGCGPAHVPHAAGADQATNWMVLVLIGLSLEHLRKRGQEHPSAGVADDVSVCTGVERQTAALPGEVPICRMVEQDFGREQEADADAQRLVDRPALLGHTDVVVALADSHQGRGSLGVQRHAGPIEAQHIGQPVGGNGVHVAGGAEGALSHRVYGTYEVPFVPGGAGVDAGGGLLHVALPEAGIVHHLVAHLERLALLGRQGCRLYRGYPELLVVKEIQTLNFAAMLAVYPPKLHAARVWVVIVVVVPLAERYKRGAIGTVAEREIHGPEVHVTWQFDGGTTHGCLPPRPLAVVQHALQVSRHLLARKVLVCRLVQDGVEGGSHGRQREAGPSELPLGSALGLQEPAAEGVGLLGRSELVGQEVGPQVHARPRLRLDLEHVGVAVKRLQLQRAVLRAQEDQAHDPVRREGLEPLHRAGVADERERLPWRARLVQKSRGPRLHLKAKDVWREWRDRVGNHVQVRVDGEECACPTGGRPRTELSQLRDPGRALLAKQALHHLRSGRKKLSLLVKTSYLVRHLRQGLLIQGQLYHAVPLGHDVVHHGHAELMRVPPCKNALHGRGREIVLHRHKPGAVAAGRPWRHVETHRRPTRTTAEKAERIGPTSRAMADATAAGAGADVA
mmetsp:Transcript_82000/g.253377  ORF Transcript_82000/g.253377 Transcript_82000/m.253377 type:complete len:734 (-) Transcript_82000:1-2202(-)